MEMAEYCFGISNIAFGAVQTNWETKYGGIQSFLKQGV
jgi:hypothetical protein